MSTVCQKNKINKHCDFFVKKHTDFKNPKNHKIKCKQSEVGVEHKLCFSLKDTDFSLLRFYFMLLKVFEVGVFLVYNLYIYMYLLTYSL